MNTIEKNILLAGVDLLNLSGINETNLDLIRDSYESTIILRGDNIILKGIESEIIDLEKIFNELIFLQKKQGQITSDDIRLVMELIGERNEDGQGFRNKFGISDNEIENIVLYKKNELIKVKNTAQLNYYKKVLENDIVFAIGPAGTGKTYLAVAFAIAALKNKTVSKIILARPAVEAGESLGFLPGDLTEKINPYLKPLYDALENMLPYEKLKTYIEKNIIEIVPLAYMRGRTLNNAFVILDEAQNATTIQMKMFLTRLGPNSRTIITGDITQIDLPKKEQSGLIQTQKILTGINGIEFVYFDKGDVVRHRLVKEIINAYEKINNGIYGQ